MDYKQHGSESKEDIYKFLSEILNHVNASGKIDVHNNQVFFFGSKSEDLPRQAFVFFTLCRVNFFLPGCVKDVTLASIFSYISKQFNEDKSLTTLEKKFIGIYVVRGCIFWKKDTDFFNGFLEEKTTSIVYSNPVCLHLFLAMEADSQRYLHKSIVLKRHLDVAREAVFYSLKSEQKDTNKAYMYTDVFYYHEILEFSIKEDVISLVLKKIKEESKSIQTLNTSVLASMFEGMSMLYPDYKKEQELLYQQCLERKIVINSYLKNKHNFTKDSLVEKINTSYVCLDVYCHLILGLLNKLDNVRYVNHK